MKITNTQKGPRGLNTVGGPVLIEPGQSIEVELSGAEHQIAAGTGWFDMPEPTAAPEPANELVAKHRGAGSYSVMRGDDEVVDKLTKDQAEAFNALDAEAKEAAVEYALADRQAA